MSTPPDATAMIAGQPPAEWPAARASLAGADTYWLSVVRPDGQPHVAPVLAVLVGTSLHVAAGHSAGVSRRTWPG